MTQYHADYIADNWCWALGRLGRWIIFLVGAWAFFVIVFGSSADAAQVPQTQLESSLFAAKIAWGVESTDPVRIVSETLGPCRKGDQSAAMDWEDSITVIRTMRESSEALDDGTVISKSEIDEMVPPIISHQLTRIIKINSACDWTREPLWETVLHEYGHVLIDPAWHSQDKKSVMFWTPSKGQVIQNADRAMIAHQSN